MLYKYTTDHSEFNFLNRSAENRKKRNVFTIIVGKNGTGKSRLLRNIALDFLGPHGGMNRFADLTPREASLRNGTAHAINEPSKLICVSTSPFDKFPLIKRNDAIPHYSYLGLRGLTTTNMGLAYISRIIYTLAEAAGRSEDHSRAIGAVLAYLNYEPVINVTFTHSSLTLLDKLLHSSEPRYVIEEYAKRSTMFNGEFLSSLRQLLSADDRVFQRFMRTALRLSDWPRRTKIEMRLTSSGVQMRGSSILSPADVVLLGRFGMLRLREVVLHKRGSDEPVMISQMSSGEQTVIMGLLGIGSQIQDSSLICIDEPEVCLHPEWQERYIQLLSQVFSHYKNCQFIVATHSPQIVAQLATEGCYVMQMESGECYRSDDFSKRSIDFQLATVFKAPGYRNEYLSRLAINTFIEVAKNKSFTLENRENLRVLEATLPNLSHDDPLIELIRSVQEVYSTYG